MNSWKSRSFGACTPPLSTLKCGTGSDGVTPSGVSHRHSGIFAEAASARASAIETPTVALAPSLLLFGVPSRSIIAWSASASELQVRPRSRPAISPLTFPAAVSTPLPPYRPVSPSRSSTASRDPVEAPEGTPARAVVPSASCIVTASVGRPRESRISSAARSATSNAAMMFSVRHADSAPAYRGTAGPYGPTTARTGAGCRDAPAVFEAVRVRRGAMMVKAARSAASGGGTDLATDGAGPNGGHGLDGDKALLAGEFVDRSECHGDSLRGVDHDRDRGNAAA